MNDTPTPARETLDGFLSHYLHRNFLKYAVGRAIVCPVCRDVMDCRRAVNAEVRLDAPQQGKSIVAISGTWCVKCWESKQKAYVESLVERSKAKVASMPPVTQINIILEVVDGRELWKPRKRTKKTPQPTPA